jgi:hypothetical protein
MSRRHWRRAVAANAFGRPGKLQFIANPAHNADRGPVSTFSARLHAEF